MKIKLYYLFIVFLSTFHLHAQGNNATTNPGSISGKILDKKTNQPIPYVNVSVLENNKIITGGITQENGNFSVKNIPLKDLLLKFSLLDTKNKH